jgi:hypothetical protein
MLTYVLLAVAATLSITSQGHRLGEAWEETRGNLLDLGEAVDICDPLLILRAYDNTYREAQAQWARGHLWRPWATHLPRQGI